MPGQVSAEWARAVADPGWGDRVARAVRRVVDDVSYSGQDVLLDDVRTDRTGPEAYLRVVYRNHPGGPRLGYQRSLDGPPAVGGDGEDQAEWLAGWVVMFELAEPLGTRASALRPDPDGVLWRGDGIEPPGG